MSRIPNKGSARQKLRQYFAANPTEELTYADAMAKFGATYRAIVVATNRMVAHGEVESIHVIRARKRP